MLLTRFGACRATRLLLLGLMALAALMSSAAGTVAQGATCASGVLAATLNGASEVPAVSTAGTGSVRLIVDPVSGVLTSAWGVGNLSSAIVAGHIHEGAVGVNGPIVVPFADLPAAGGSFSLLSSAPPTTLANVLANPGGFYVNLHTSFAPQGEVRGQLSCAQAPGTVMLAARLSGAEEVPPVSTDATATVQLTLDRQTGTVIGSWRVTGLSAELTAAHIHQGGLGVNGPIVVPFTNLPASGGSFTTTGSVTPAVIDSIVANPGGFYVNVHSATRPNGEIRGQLTTAGPQQIRLPLLPQSSTLMAAR
jgi:Cu/Zn superoxide dismutase